MATVTGRVISVKEKENRSGNPYQGVTIKDAEGNRYWFGNYKQPIPKGAEITVTAKSTSEGTGGLTFLNSIQDVVLVSVPKMGPRQSSPGLPIEDDTPPDDVKRVAVPPTPPNRAPKVMEDPSPSGTIDDLAEGKDPARFGGTIVFRSGMTKAEVEGVLRAISGAVANADIREFDPKVGGPVFYIP